MSKRQQFALCLAAYLTGWVIAQSIFVRVWKHVMSKSVEAGQDDFIDRLATRVAAEVAQGVEAA